MLVQIKWFNPINEKNKNKLYYQIENLKSILKTCFNKEDIVDNQGVGKPS